MSCHRLSLEQGHRTKKKKDARPARFFALSHGRAGHSRHPDLSEE